MRRAVVVRHVHFEDLGAFAAPLAATGYCACYRDAGLGGVQSGKAGRPCLAEWLDGLR